MNRNPSPFEVAHAIGSNVAKGFTAYEDRTALDDILSQAAKTNNPNAINDVMGQILTRVSKDRRPEALALLQNKMKLSIDQQEKDRKRALEEKERLAKIKMGIDPDLPIPLAKDVYKEKNKQNAIEQVYGNTENTSNPYATMSNDELIKRSGSPYKEISEPAKQQLKSNQEEKKITQKEGAKFFEANLNRAEKTLGEADKIASVLPQKKSALNLMRNALAEKDFGFFSRDQLAESLGIEGLRSKEGAIFKTAGKEFFLGSIIRAGARPNQWIEQQIQDMMAKIGRDNASNLGVTEAMQTEVNLDDERVRITEEISDRMIEQGNLSRQGLNREVNKHMLKYAEDQQDLLFNNLRAIKAIDENKPQRYKKVPKGTKPSPYMLKALNSQFNGDWEKASDEAIKLGYSVDE